MSDVSFDDLIPQQPQSNGQISFDDLIPQPTQQMSGFARSIAFPASNALKGFDMVAGLPGQIAQTYDAYVGAPTARALSGQPIQFGTPDPNFMKLMPATGQEIQQSTKNAGLTDRPDLQPQSTAETLYGAGMQGVGGAAPLALLGDEVDAAKQLTAGFGAGIGGQTGTNLANKIPDSWPLTKSVAQNTLPLLGGLFGGGTGAATANTAERTINAIQGDQGPIIKAYNDLGIKPVLAGDVSGNPTMQSIQAYAQNATIGSKRVLDASKNAMDQFKDRVDSVASQMGNSSTIQQAGSVLQDEGKNWLSNYKLSNQQNWNNVDDLIGKSTPVSLANTKQVLQSIYGNAGNNKSAQSFLTSSLTKNVANIVKESEGGGGLGEFGTAVSPKPIQWQTAQGIRTRVGEYLSDPMSISDAGQAQAKMLYGALTKDMQNTAFSTGNQQAMNAFQNANNFTTQGHNFVENVLSKIQGTTPEQAASNVLSTGTKGGTILQSIRQQMPNAADELGAYRIRNGLEKGTPSGWLTSGNKLSEEAENALYPDPFIKQKLTSANTVAQSMKNTENFLNKSGTGRHNDMTTMAIMAGEIPSAAMVGYSMAGLPGALKGAGISSIPLASTMVSGPLASRLTVNPALARFMGSSITTPPLGFMPAYGMGILGSSGSQ